MKGRKSTTVELVKELKACNVKGCFDKLISNAEAGRYHDAFHPDGKLQFLRDTEQFPDLVDLRLEIRNGVYDELPQENHVVVKQNTPIIFRAALPL
ncbi:hypothetical protein [Rufibacter hautae]|uniref:Uncharacterized protein n=1 Tax=Rufibacter hautae TaxID=2595005 RepID=A0A5B6TEL7_9BACT|nr:hypothetical protein [Rufibacter hautae]KAA3437735.1 hypothetical protein FOA19_10555 [Rufibacter hautae]